MAIHFAGTPISFMANVHTAAATQNFIAMELHSVDVPWWASLASGLEKPLNDRGFAHVPEKPGLGIELNEEVVKEHLVKDGKLFAPTPEWNEKQSWDRLWS
jgi:L-alanine-DL-glutamate epimerase-like enolase superfamily enzyme